MIAFLSTHLSLRLPPFPKETLSPLTNVAKFDMGVEIKKGITFPQVSWKLMVIQKGLRILWHT